MSKRSFPSIDGRSAPTPAAASASSASSSAPAAKRVKLDDLLSEEYAGKQVTHSSVPELVIGDLPPAHKSYDREHEESEEPDLDEILRLVESAPEVAPLDLPTTKQMLSRFGKAVRKNEEMRGKYPEQPDKFLDSELALDESLRELRGLVAAPHFYPLLLEESAATGGESALTTLCALILNHDNLDIAIDGVRLVHELIDAELIGDALAEQDEEEPEGVTRLQQFVDHITGGKDEEEEKEEKGTSAAAASSSSSSSSSSSRPPPLFLCTLVNCLSRFPSEHVSEQGEAVEQVLSILEHLTDLHPQRVSRALVSHTSLLEWCLDRLSVSSFDSRKLYASEIMSIVLTNAGRKGQDAMARLKEGKAIRTLVSYIRSYRQSDPSNSEESEYLQNLFDVLVVCLHDHDDNQLAFTRDAQGLQLMIEMIRRNAHTKSAAFKVIDYALQNCAPNCEQFIDVGGLKTLFGAYMLAPTTKRDKAAATDMELCFLHILTHLFLHVADVRYLRLLRKFQEAEMVKTERTVELLQQYQQRVDDAESKYARESGVTPSSDPNDLETYLRKMDYGLAHVEQASIVLAFLATAGDKELLSRVEQLLYQQDLSLSDVQRTLQQYVSMMADSPEGTPLHKNKAILQALITMLEENSKNNES